MTSTAYSVQQSVETPNVTRFPSMVNNNHQNDHDHHDYDNNNKIDINDVIKMSKYIKDSGDTSE